MLTTLIFCVVPLVQISLVDDFDFGTGLFSNKWSPTILQWYIYHKPGIGELLQQAFQFIFCKLFGSLEYWRMLYAFSALKIFLGVHMDRPDNAVFPFISTVREQREQRPVSGEGLMLERCHSRQTAQGGLQDYLNPKTLAIRIFRFWHFYTYYSQFHQHILKEDLHMFTQIYCKMFPILCQAHTVTVADLHGATWSGLIYSNECNIHQHNLL